MSKHPSESPDDDLRIDGRRRADITDELREMVPYYVDEWDLEEADVGTALLSLFAELAEEVTQRLDRVPEKHRIAFYETLGFDREPPQSAQIPLTVSVADGIDDTVTVPAGSVATAEPPDAPEQYFEIPDGGTFDATPANITAVFAADPSEDGIYDHRDVVGGGDSASLFVPDTSQNLQKHVLYFGDKEGLSVGNGSTLTIEIDTDADPDWLFDTLDWEYYGERTVDDETVEGWHLFPSQRAYSTVSLYPSTGYGVLSQGRYQSYSVENPSFRNSDENVEMQLVPDGTLTETSVAGIETNWIRARVPENIDEPALERAFETEFGTADSSARPVKIGSSASDLSPDKLLHNDVPLATGEGETPIRPFGEHPRQQDTFYLASTDALTKTGEEVTITVDYRAEGSGSPVLSWEYYDGSGWSRIPEVADNTHDFRGLKDVSSRDDEMALYSLYLKQTYEVKGSQSDNSEDSDTSATVTFTVPRDLSKTTVSGHEGHWIRVRLVDGDYGQLEFISVNSNSNSAPEKYKQSASNINPPEFSNISLSYDKGDAPRHVVAENNLDYEADIANGGGSYTPFKPLPLDDQALFVGFDGPLTDGPLNLLFDLEDAAYPRTFYPQVRWEYEDAATGQWVRPDSTDNTEGLTERGLLGLVFPETTEATRAFGRNLHWLRARVTGDQFGVAEENEDDDAGSSESRRRGCGRYVETVPPAGQPKPYPPSIRGLYLNATWAHNRRRIESELLGSSDGTLDQTFTVSNPPVRDSTVWVDESAVLSEGDRRTLKSQWPERTEEVPDTTGDIAAFWVQWQQQPDLLDSGPEDRHYTVDKIAGRVSFGDGTQGMAPPRGTENVRASYVTGGGASGNIPAEAVSGFRQSIAFVESVTNPLAGAAGAEAEPTAEVTDRAARELRDRNRAVAPTDFERIAMDASRQLARARCRPAMDPNGEYKPGWVTLLIVPESGETRPRPSATLRQDVENAIDNRAPAALTTPKTDDRLVVRGPSYVSVSVEAHLVASGGSLSQLEERARETVRSFLHPLTGGRVGDGWRFGELPCRSDFFELLEGLEHVDHIQSLSIAFDTDQSLVTVTEGQPNPETSPDALVSAGTQEMRATLADKEGGRK